MAGGLRAYRASFGASNTTIIFSFFFFFFVFLFFVLFFFLPVFFLPFLSSLLFAAAGAGAGDVYSVRGTCCTVSPLFSYTHLTLPPKA